MIADADPEAWRHDLGLDAVPLLRPQGSHEDVCICRRQSRVIQMETGGGFGGKEEYPSMIAGHAALLAMKSGRPVKSSTTAPRTWPRRRSAIRRALATGRRSQRRQNSWRRNRLRHRRRRVRHAFTGRSVARHDSRRRPVRWPNVRIRAKAVATNAPPHGAFRGFGAPQSLFAMERHMDRIAQTVDCRR